MSTLHLPKFLPDGSTLVEDSDFTKRLHEGDATVGWVGDPALGIYFSNGCLEIRRMGPNGETYLITRAKPHVRVLNAQTLRWLAEHDSMSRRQYRVNDDIDSTNNRVEQNLRTAAREKQAEAAERLYWALKRDIGAYEGGTTRDVWKMPEAPWKTKDGSNEGHGEATEAGPQGDCHDCIDCRGCGCGCAEEGPEAGS